MILYFTGTGNSKFVAKALAEQLDDRVFCINDCTKLGKAAELTSEKPWVFIAPIYLSALPRVVEDFIRRSRFSGSKKAWFIVTSAGTGACACPAFAKQLSEEKDFEYMGTLNVTMPQNYLVFFQTKGPNESRSIIEAAKPRIAELGGYIAEEKPFPDSGMKDWELITTNMILEPYYKWFMGTKKFRVSDACIHCGKCSRVCPLGNISMSGGKPYWGDRCTHCMACINLCPKEAIEYGRASVGKPRYHCPEYK